MVVRELFAKLGLNVDKESFDQGDAAIATVRRGLVALGAVAASAAAGIGLMVREVAAAGDRIDKTSQAVGVSAREFQELEHAATMSGIGVEQFAGILKEFAKITHEARSGNEGAAASFTRLGISLVDASGNTKTSATLIEEIADRFRGVSNESERTALAMRLFGGEGAKMIPLLAGGAAEVANLRREAHALGIVLSDEDVAASAEFSDSMSRVRLSLQGIRNLIAGPMLKSAAEWLQALTAWIVENRELVASNVRGFILGIVAAAKVLVAVIGPVVKLLARLATWLVTSQRVLKTLRVALYATLVPLSLWLVGLAATALQAKLTAASITSFLLPAVLGWIQTQIGAASATWAAIVPLVLLGAKIALVAAAVFLLGEEIYSLWEGSSSVFNDIGYLLGELWTEMKWLWRQFDAWASGIIDGWRAAFVGFWDWLVNLIRGIPGQLREGVRGFATSLPGGEFVMNRFFGGGASPEAAAVSSPSSSMNATTVNAPVNAPITINAAPGMSVEDVASEATSQFQSALDAWLSEAAAVVG